MHRDTTVFAGRRIARLLVLVGLVLAAYALLSLFEHAARADGNAVDPVTKGGAVASVKHLSDGAGKAVPAIRAGKRHGAAPRGDTGISAAPKSVARKVVAHRSVARAEGRRSAAAKVDASPRKVAAATVRTSKGDVRKAAASVTPRVKAARKTVRTAQLLEHAALPDLLDPRLPELSRITDRSVLPELPRLPALPVLPALPALPALPVLPTPPAVPVLPALPHVPAAVQGLAPPAPAVVQPAAQQPAPPQPSASGQSRPQTTAPSAVIILAASRDVAGPAAVGQARAQAGPLPAPAPAPAGRPADNSAVAGQTRDSGGGSSPTTGTVPSSWRPESVAAGHTSAASVAARGRNVRYSGPPS